MHRFFFFLMAACLLVGCGSSGPAISAANAQVSQAQAQAKTGDLTPVGTWGGYFPDSNFEDGVALTIRRSGSTLLATGVIIRGDEATPIRGSGVARDNAFLMNLSDIGGPKTYSIVGTFDPTTAIATYLDKTTNERISFEASLLDDEVVAAELAARNVRPQVSVPQQFFLHYENRLGTAQREINLTFTDIPAPPLFQGVWSAASENDAILGISQGETRQNATYFLLFPKWSISELIPTGGEFPIAFAIWRRGVFEINTFPGKRARLYGSLEVAIEDDYSGCENCYVEFIDPNFP